MTKRTATDVAIARAETKLIVHEGDYVFIANRRIVVRKPMKLMAFLEEQGFDSDDDDERPGVAMEAQLNGPMLNRLEALTKTPKVRERCRALYRIIAAEPNHRALEYGRLMRDRHPEIDMPTEEKQARQWMERTLDILVRIEAVRKKDRLFRVT